MGAADAFLEKFKGLAQTYQKKCIVFSDKLEFNFSMLKAHVPKLPKTVTVFLSINLDGTFLKPFVVFPSSVAVKDFNNAELISWTFTDHGTADDAALERWVAESLVFEPSPSALLAQEYGVLSTAAVRQTLRKSSIEPLFFPKGSNCMLNPFRKISPLFLSALQRESSESEYVKEKKRLKGEKVLMWTIRAIDLLVSGYAGVLQNVFETFKF